MCGRASRIILRIRRDLGDGDVSRRAYEFSELPVGHRYAIHPEAVHGNPMCRSFFGIMLVRSHAESGTGYPDHPVGLRSTGRDVSLECGCREKRCHLARCLPIDRQNCDLAGGHATQEPCHRLLDRGPTSERSNERHWDGPSGACAHGLHRGDIGPLFLSGGKIPVDSTQKSWTARAGFPPKNVLRLQLGDV